MTKHEFKEATKWELFMTLRPSKAEMEKLNNMHKECKIIHPSITCQELTNYRSIKTVEENLKLQCIVANSYLLGLTHDDIINNAETVWEMIDNN